MPRKKKDAAVDSSKKDSGGQERANVLNTLMNKGRQKKLSYVFNAAQKDFAMSYTGKHSSGELGLDVALGGGWEIGRTHLIYGPFNCGKSFTFVSTASAISREGKSVLYLDYEGTSDPSFFEALGGNLDLIDIAKTFNLEDALDMIEAAILSSQYGAVFLDSVAALSSKAEQEKNHSEVTMAKTAKGMSRLCREVDSYQNRLIIEGEVPPTFFMVNQPRKRMDDPNGIYLPGGEQQLNKSSTVVSLFPNSYISTGTGADKEIFGRLTKYRIERNKCGPAYKQGIYGIIQDPIDGHPKTSYYHGDTIFELGKAFNLIQQSGAWYGIGELGLRYQGGSNLKSAIVNQEEIGRYLVDKIKEQVLATYGFDPEFNYDCVRGDERGSGQTSDVPEVGEDIPA